MSPAPPGSRPRWRYLALVLSGLLVLLMAGVGLVATRSGSHTAQQTHRRDRLLLEQVLGGLTGQTMASYYAALTRSLAVQDQAGVPAFSALPGTAAAARDRARLTRLLKDVGGFDAGGGIVNRTGALVVRTATGTEPAVTDPGLRPLTDAVLHPGTALPLSGVVERGPRPLLALGAPVRLSDGTTGLLIGLYSARDSLMQGYNVELGREHQGEGWVSDPQGLAVIAPSNPQVGSPVPYPQMLAAVAASPATSGVVSSREGQVDYVTTWSRVPGTQWVAMAVQRKAQFSGALDTAARRSQIAVLAMLLICGTTLVVMNHRRVQAMAALAATDELTRIHNRRGWFLAAEAELQRSARSGKQQLLLFVDLDGLKQVNDQLGHREGDRAIASAASVLTGACRPGDLVGRLGGDEFVVLLGPGVGPEAARRRVRDALRAYNAGSAAAFELRMSIGTVVWDPAHPVTAEELVRAGDARMYEDKRQRPERYQGLLRVPATRS